MKLIQISAGDGPEECGLAVAKLIPVMLADAKANGLSLNLEDSVSWKMACKSSRPKALKSAVLVLADANKITSGTTPETTPEARSTNVQRWLESWTGTVQWISQSPLRPKHKRKNWFVDVSVFEATRELPDSGLKFETCRASGAGGQHVNTTDSAVRCVHIATGISVRVESQRSQHANRKLAKVLIEHKLQQLGDQAKLERNQQQWMAHKQLERGAPVRVFRGETLTPQ